MRGLLVVMVLISITGGVFAGRAVTQEERAKLAAAVTAEGCSGGEMEFEDENFEVDNVICADGKKYDLDFDRSFRLIKKELAD